MDGMSAEFVTPNEYTFAEQCPIQSTVAKFWHLCTDDFSPVLHIGIRFRGLSVPIADKAYLGLPSVRIRDQAFQFR
jgi:hypothetical protein